MKGTHALHAQIDADAIHGGPDAWGAARHDFSSNSNACGACAPALAMLQSVDVTQYPDPTYSALRRRLASFHDVAVERIVLAASASEAIFRLTAWACQAGVRTVHLPAHHYGDYARAAQTWGLQRSADGAGALCWACEPSSPLGQAQVLGSLDVAALTVLDLAYAPLRLSGVATLSAAQLHRVWQLFTPNKALGLTGVRAAYLIAPEADDTSAKKAGCPAVSALQRLAPSWPLGAHGVALLQAWTQPDVQAWLAESLPTLRDWKARQTALLQRAGWTVLPSQANFFCARAPQPLDATGLRRQFGIKLRDATSFGLPGWWRISVLAPPAQDALAQALAALNRVPATVEAAT